MSSSLPMLPYMKIRQYVLRLLESAEGPEKIKSENELCRMFGVSRNTVRKALKDMVDEDYLIIQPGVGTFINPYKSTAKRINEKISIGLGFGNGRQVHHGCIETNFCRGLFKILGQIDINVCFVSFLHQDALILEELEVLNLNGLVWLHPNILLRQHAKKIKKLLPAVFTTRDAFPQTSVIARNPEQRGALIARYFIEHNLTDSVFIKLSTEYSELIHKGFMAEYKSRNIKHNKKLVIEEKEHPVDKLKNMIEFNYPFKAVYTPGFYSEINNLLKENNISVPILAEVSEKDALKGNTLRLVCDMELAGEKAGKILLDIIEKKIIPKKPFNVNWQIVKPKTKKK